MCVCVVFGCVVGDSGKSVWLFKDKTTHFKLVTLGNRPRPQRLTGLKCEKQCSSEAQGTGGCLSKVKGQDKRGHWTAGTSDSPGSSAESPRSQTSLWTLLRPRGAECQQAPWERILSPAGLGNHCFRDREWSSREAAETGAETRSSRRRGQDRRRSQDRFFNNRQQDWVRLPKDGRGGQ